MKRRLLSLMLVVFVVFLSLPMNAVYADPWNPDDPDYDPYYDPASDPGQPPYDPMNPWENWNFWGSAWDDDNTFCYFIDDYHGECYITEYAGNESEIWIPGDAFGRTVDGIGEYAFSGNTDLETVYFTSSMTIGNHAFSGCTNLSSVDFTGVCGIDDFAFENCTSLTSVELYNITHGAFSPRAFSGCTNLQSVTVDPDNSQEFVSYDGVLFEHNYGSIHDEYIYQLALYPEGKTAASYTIPDFNQSWAISIGEYAFANNTHLQTLTIPTSVDYVFDNAFEGCSALQTVYYGGTEACWNVDDPGIGVSGLYIENDNNGNDALVNATVICSDTVIATPTPEPTPEPTPAPVPTYLTIAHKPNKISYYLGEAFSIDGLQVNVTYSDGSRVTVGAQDVTYDEPDNSISGVQNVTVYYGGLSKSFAVRFDGRSDVRSIALASKPTKLVYAKGERFDSTGMVVNAMGFNNEIVETLSLDDIRISGFSTSDRDAGVYQCIISYLDYYRTGLSYRVIDEKVIASYIITKPTKLIYNIGEQFDTTGMEASVKYYDGTTEPISLDNFTITGFDNQTAGLQTIRVLHQNNIVKTFTIRVR